MAVQRHPETLPEGMLCCDRTLEHSQAAEYSLTGHAFIAIERYAVEQDLSFSHASEQWLTRRWTSWVRSKLLEHLLGWRRWSAFSVRDFALLRRESVLHIVQESVMEEVINRLANGGENLDIMDWAMHNDIDVDGVIHLLDRININEKRQRLLTGHIRLFLQAEKGEV